MMAPPISVLAIITTRTLSVASGHAIRRTYYYSTYVYPAASNMLRAVVRLNVYYDNSMPGEL